ncbi:adrenomedullin 2 [Chelydra serpentina]|uniref:Adrenomedullin 2 n=1 Tax=Chelydra serpentina TaxID=8475 RepID=A0A8T1S4B2_CHESE|nr:adrenomedullin 2 [Chelydra serpentina]
MKSLPPVALGCISLTLCLLQLPGSLPLPMGRTLLLPKHREPPDRRPAPPLGHRPLKRRTVELLRVGTARARLDREQPWGTPATLLQPLAGPEGRALRSLTGPRRAKRHAAPRRHHAHLMRVGCSLGTCQVQNLGHRLWQLMGQSGRQDSSPMNPNSPHSYG